VLIMTIYTAAGGVAFTASLAAPVEKDYVVGAGLGVGDFVYGLDATQAGALQGVLNSASGGDFSAYRIGLESSVSYVDDGPDTWLVANANGGVCVPAPNNNFCGQNFVPEPGVLSLTAVALLGAAVSTRRRRRV
jgi:hypothetical protein